MEDVHGKDHKTEHNKELKFVSVVSEAGDISLPQTVQTGSGIHPTSYSWISVTSSWG
jgi:hypothetical protein